MALTQKMAASVWDDPAYYHQSQTASETAHPALTLLACRYQGKKILEVGCGEGTKLKALKARYRVGVDVSKVAISHAKLKLDQAIVVDATKLPFPNHSFDAALSFFSIEHMENPEKVLAEMLRVVKPYGELCILTPNFGAPNRSSPCYKGSRIVKLITGFFTDLLFSSNSTLSWNHVTPLTEKFSYQSDYDTVVEPYLLSLKRYLESKSCQVVIADSYWQIPFEKENFLQKIFKYLGTLNVFPFKFWGPHCFIIVRCL